MTTTGCTTALSRKYDLSFCLILSLLRLWCNHLTDPQAIYNPCKRFGDKLICCTLMSSWLL